MFKNANADYPANANADINY